MREAIAKNLIRLRGARSREEVAKAVGISVSALAMYETAQRIPRDDIKMRLSEYYGVPVQEIFYNQKLHTSCRNDSNQHTAREVG